MKRQTAMGLGPLKSRAQENPPWRAQIVAKNKTIRGDIGNHYTAKQLKKPETSAEH